MYVYDADASSWVRLFEGTSAGSSAHGASGNVQLSLGTGAFTSTNNLNFNTSSNELTVEVDIVHSKTPVSTEPYERLIIAQ